MYKSVIKNSSTPNLNPQSTYLKEIKKTGTVLVLSPAKKQSTGEIMETLLSTNQIIPTNKVKVTEINEAATSNQIPNNQLTVNEFDNGSSTTQFLVSLLFPFLQVSIFVLALFTEVPYKFWGMDELEAGFLTLIALYTIGIVADIAGILIAKSGLREGDDRKCLIPLVMNSLVIAIKVLPIVLLLLGLLTGYIA